VASVDVVEATGLSYRQLDHWAVAGLAHPVPDPAMRTGRSRWWPLAEVRRLVVMARLVRAGIGPSAASAYAGTACGASSPYGTASVLLGEAATLLVMVPTVTLSADGRVEVGW